jgi:hypothetical protein
MMDKETESIWRTLDQEVMLLVGRWKIHKQLFQSGKENVDLLNNSGSYVFHLLQIMIIDNIFLTLSRLTDPAQQGRNKNASIHNLVTRMDGVIDDALLLNLRTRLAEIEKVCKNMRTHRSKRIAHIDTKRGLKASSVWLPPVTYGEIEDALKLTREMMCDITLALFDRYTDYDPGFAYGSDGNHLLHVLRKAHEAAQTDI